MEKPVQISNQVINQLSKKELLSMAEQLMIQACESGSNDPMEMLVQVRKAKEYCAAMEKAVDTYARDEFMKHGEKTVKIGNSEISLRHGYDVPDLQDDPIYKELYDQLKKREEQLKDVFKGKNIFDPDTGEEVPKVPVLRATKDSLALKF